jgi:uncharacterized protein
VHPPKIVTYNLLEKTSTINDACFKVDTYEVTDPWLYVTRPLIGHSHISYLKGFVIYDLGIQISQFKYHTANVPDKYGFYDYYVDVGTVKKDKSLWLLKDLYLDILVVQTKAAHILDTDEFLQALQENLITPDEAAFALTTTHDLINGLANCHYNLESYLDTKGIKLPWHYLK